MAPPMVLMPSGFHERDLVSPTPGIESLPLDNSGRLRGFTVDAKGRHPVDDLNTAKTNRNAA